MNLYNNFAPQKRVMTIFLYGVLLLLGGCVSNGGLSINGMKNSDALSLTRTQTPLALKTYIYTNSGEGYWVDVSVNNVN